MDKEKIYKAFKPRATGPALAAAVASGLVIEDKNFSLWRMKAVVHVGDYRPYFSVDFDEVKLLRCFQGIPRISCFCVFNVLMLFEIFIYMK
jgi:hypothetical protein